ncbi:MAG: ribose 5-phosphate isomerase B [Chlorobi bacterium]|nr:ribose 5-phosphate isomerase B [Chlorobiota bacterium]
MAENKVIGMATDHGGFAMKEYLKKELTKAGYKVKDFGTFSEESVDYPDYIHPLANEVNKGVLKRGIILCGSGNGAQMTANKYMNVRAALCWNEEQARLARQHNDANIISLPGRFIAFDLAWEIVQLFLNTPFEGGRHLRRIKKIPKILS